MPQNEAEALVSETSQRLASLKAEDIMTTGLHPFIDQFQTTLNGIGAAISGTYFQIPTPA